ncbi:hypothetical protein HNP38_001004 [Chryseobacterium defluvii]|uniref:Uncharacterized protein n=1 Tax=Chryseobacterium defluvii TaxID=160396 RepID=A0A840KFL2_9FLAO|nr:hypothetical protein [Chryseobacterium defluvii]MBB4805732.1 hypothetical protein [Chryseobacterium defluvii]
MTKKFIILAALCMISYSKAQDKAEQALRIFAEKYPQEKVHLLFNKSSYVAGENLWFKSFVFDGYAISNISTSLYIEFYDSHKIQIAKKLISLFKGEGHGSIALPEKLKEGIYYIRAYTAWMANFNEDFQLIQPIEVYNPNSPERLTMNTVSDWTASAYPESGTFISDINTKFAVRLRSETFTPSDWHGYLIDMEKPDVKITSFKGFDQNVGSFSFTPQSGKKYGLVIQDNMGKKQSIDLPNVSDSGINLQVISSMDAVKYTLKSKNLSQENNYYTVLGTINNRLVHKAQFKKLSDQPYSNPY